MDKIIISGGRRLSGKVEILGAKNAALPLMVSSMLTSEPVVLNNIPHLTDIETMAALLASHGIKVSWPNQRQIELTAYDIINTTADYELVSKMRASVLVLGPLLARIGHARVSLPGGCAIGTRPVDIHLSGLSQLGAEITLVDGYIEARVDGGLKGTTVPLQFPSVGATENLMMAATLAKGKTILQNAAREPEVVDLARCLVKMGAEIYGIGSDELVIIGKKEMHGVVHAVVADRIEAGTYAMAAAITAGDVELIGATPEHFEVPLKTLSQFGSIIRKTDKGIRVSVSERLKAADITTNIYPGFPTDLQAQAMALMTVAEGAAVVTETIFENRFMHVPELLRLGADITVRGGTALVRGVPRLRGAPLIATDLRASSSLVLAGLVAEGETTVSHLHHIDRGYESIEKKLSDLGAKVTREVTRSSLK